MPSKNPNGRPLAKTPAAWSQDALEEDAAQAMQDAGLPTEDVRRMRFQVSMTRSPTGALRSIARWVDLGRPKKP